MCSFEYITAIGQDSHRFIDTNLQDEKRLVLGGITITDAPGLKANSDGDVILHALTNAISGITGINILGKIADKICIEDNNTDSEVYLVEALKYLNDEQITHVSITVECLRPHLCEYIDNIKNNIARIIKISPSAIGLTATTGEQLTDCGRGYGVSVFCVITVRRLTQSHSD